MARIRSIKPDFFFDEETATLHPDAQLLLLGLSTLADRDGRLENRPVRIKAALFPYRDVDVEARLSDLESAGAVVRYETNGKRCLALVHWSRDQKPHPKETSFNLPDPPEKSRGRSRQDSDASRRVPMVVGSGCGSGNGSTATQGPADTVPGVGPEELPDATEDATPVEPAANGCPDCTSRAPCWVHLRDAVPAKSPKPPRQPSEAERLYLRIQEARQRACEAAGVAYVPDRWAAPRINKDLGALVKGTPEDREKFEATFHEFLGDESMGAKGWSLSYLMNGGVRSKYEQRALNGERGAA